ncbi:MAG TPA: hemerythrin domain-containing protein [Stenomitos sp.]
MVTTLTTDRRNAIAQKLAEIREVQSFLIENEQRFLSECQDSEICDRLQDMLEDDQKNLGIVETTMTQYGVQSEPSGVVQRKITQLKENLNDSELNLYDKMVQFELLKHSQVMAGLVVHKAAQIVGADVEQAIAPLNVVNFENRAHQEQLKSLLEYVGTQELTGEQPKQGLWHRMQDAVAAMTGIAGSAVTQGSDKRDMDITDLIFMDHQKAKTLIREIEKSSDASQASEYFTQLYMDLLAHAKAEEETVYPTVRSFYGDENTQELYDEQAQLESTLNQMKACEINSSEFKSMLQQVKSMIGDHTRQEESTMFSSMRTNLSSEQREQIATQFKECKQRFQSENS